MENVNYQLTKLKRKFREFVALYDLSDESIVSKINHSKRVCNKSLYLGRKLNLDAENMYLAGTIGLIHDVARFEQWTRFKTYKDSQKFNHSYMSNHVLFNVDRSVKGRLIDFFEIPVKYHDIVRFAICNHGNKEISPLCNNLRGTNNGNTAMFHAKLIRDADKLDLLNNFSHVVLLMKKGFNEQRSTLQRTEGASSAVLQEFNNHRLVDRTNVVTILDYALMQTAFGYDFNFEPPKQIYINKLASNIYKSFRPYLNQADAQTLRFHIQNQLKYLKNKR